MTDFLAKNLAYLLRGGEKVQTPLAQAIGVGQPTVSKWSRLMQTKSASEPGFRSMARLCQKLNVSLDDLAFRDIEETGMSPVVSSQPARLDEGKLASLIETVDSAFSGTVLEKDAATKARAVAMIISDDQLSTGSKAMVAAFLSGIVASASMERSK